jgi:hypothetical protein
MKKSRPGRGADQTSIKGLFRLSKAGQNAFQELFFPSKPPGALQRTFLETMQNVAQRTDRWLVSRQGLA